MLPALRAWSAACSTGEEPYTLAMVLLAALGWQVEIVATDLSTRVLEAARAALWPLKKAGEIPERYLKAFMLRGVGSQEGTMKAGPELRAVVRFERFNLTSPRCDRGGHFDVVFCRNVLIYFARETKLRVVSSLLETLTPTGHLFLGHSETLVVDDSAVVRQAMVSIIERQPGMRVTVAADPLIAARKMAERSAELACHASANDWVVPRNHPSPRRFPR